MKKYILCTIVFFSGYLKADPLKITISDSRQDKMKIVLGIFNTDEHVSEIAKIIKHDLLCSAQKKTGFAVTLKSFEAIPRKNELQKFYQQGYPIALFLSKQGSSLEWRIYDTCNAKMTTGKKSRLMSDHELVAHDISDKLWFHLTGQEGIFSTRLAYCREYTNNKHFLKDICIQYPFSNKRMTLIKKGKLFAPRWNKDAKHPRLLYSEATPTNVRLMMTTLGGKRTIVSNLEGVNMLPSFSADGNQIVYCFTRNGKSQLFYGTIDQAKRCYMRQLTHRGNNISPNLLENGDIIFCSDFETKRPQIYYFSAQNQSFQRLTQGGYCVSPVMCKRVNKIAYCKMLEGISQIFIYDLKTKKHQQITFDAVHKDECAWSPCGTYLAYAQEMGSQKRIAALNLLTKEQFYISDPSERCSYPAWSDRYLASD